jgi:hypothetical protein
MIDLTEKSFGNDYLSINSYLFSTSTSIVSTLFGVNNINYIKSSEINIIKNELLSLYNQSIITRFENELLSREIVWNLQKIDLTTKYEEWYKTVLFIIENGKNDWNNNLQKFEIAYNNWKSNFQNEYKETSEAWTNSYLSGINDKEEWFYQIELLAQNASSDFLISNIGMEADRLSKNMYLRDPIITLNNNAINESKEILDNLLIMSGFLNDMSDFLKGFSTISTIHINTNIYTGIIDSNIIKANAYDFAQKTNSDMASFELLKLSININDSMEAAIKDIYNNLDTSNQCIRKNIENTFISNGQWQKTGNNYTKNIIINSTLFEPVIEKNIKVYEYIDFRINPIELKNSVSNYNLENLDSYAIMNIIDNMQNEIVSIANDIFGTNEEKEIIKFTDDILLLNTSDNNLRYLNPGKFGRYIGYEPALKEIKEKVTDRTDVFYDEGSGELGRLLSDYFYWAIIDSYGVNLLSMPAWDKPMWDDTNSCFEAPSLRSIIQITNSIGVAIASTILTPLTGGASLFGFMAIMAGINSVDDFIFSSLDYLGGYKTIDESLFEFGKSALINIASSFSSGIFNGVASAAGTGFFAAGNGLSGLVAQSTTNTFNQVMNSALMAGVQTLTTGLVTSGISGITYNNKDGWGYSTDIFTDSIKNTLINTVTSFGSNLTYGVLKTVNSGYSNEKILGFNSMNINNVDKLNALIGSLAGQGIQYALTGDFTLNILNTSIFGNNSINVGLLELRLGSNNKHLFGIGSNGVNFSPDNLYNSLQGLNILQLKNRISNYVTNNNFKEEFTLQAQYGYGDDQIKNQLFNILNGIDEISLTYNQAYDAQTKIENDKRIIYLNNYYEGMNFDDQLRLAITLGHEAYRDGIDSDKNYIETRIAVTAHTLMAIKMLDDGKLFTLDNNILNDLHSFMNSLNDFSSFNSYIDNYYNSLSDFWKLTNEGNLEYDGFATLVDEDGNILLSYKDMGLNKNTSIEGALLYLLNVNPNDKEKVNAVRQMMVNSGLVHTSDPNPDKWFWLGTKDALIGYENGNPLDITGSNMGIQISMNDIIKLYTTIDATDAEIAVSINRIYQNPINFINYSETGLNGGIAYNLLLSALPFAEFEYISTNIRIYNYLIKNGINTDSMVTGNPERTSEFNFTYKDIKLSSSSIPGAAFFSEDHTGIDYGTGGTGINFLDGYWQLIARDDHRVTYQLFGSDLKLRIMHLNPDELKKLTVETVFGGSNPVQLNYPDKSYGSGSGAHIHIDMTRNLPYNGVYTRQFVNPATLLPGSRLNYQFTYMGADKNPLKGYPGNFIRY